MRFILGLLLLLVVGAAVLWYAGGYASFDPSQQGRDARAAISPGMSWEQVFDSVGEPKEYRPILLKTKRSGGETFEFLKPGPPNKFNRAGLADRLAENSLQYGFLCTFRYSQSVAFTVAFDASGTVVGVDDAPTMADLLQYHND